MKVEDWKDIKHFTPNENWGDVSLINFELVKKLDQLRDLSGTPILITCGTQGKHVAHSLHYKGMAADLVCPEKKLAELPEIAEIAAALGFKGIGLYPHWQCHGKVIGGMHLDVRLTALLASWIGLKDGTYIQLNKANVTRLFSEDDHI